MKKNVMIFLVTVFLLVCAANLIAQVNLDPKAEIVIKGKYGFSDGEFGFKVFEDQSWIEPSGIAIDSKGNIYIADPLNNRIQKFDKNGKFLFKIKFDIQLHRFAKTLDDVAVDPEDNLYAVSRHEQKIFKYDQNGKFARSINLKEMDIAWDKWRGWRSGSYLQPNRISVDKIGNVYLEGFDELIKFGANGKLGKKWSRENYSREASYFIDQSGYLYFSKKIDIWEKYDLKGNPLGPITCEKEPLLAYIQTEDRRCQFPPKFIDKNGFRYYFELKPKTSDLTSIVKVEQNGSFKKYKMPPIDTIGQSLNMFKFDNEGNFYGYRYDDAKQVYWIEKYVFN